MTIEVDHLEELVKCQLFLVYDILKIDKKHSLAISVSEFTECLKKVFNKRNDFVDSRESLEFWKNLFSVDDIWQSMKNFNSLYKDIFEQFNEYNAKSVHLRDRLIDLLKKYDDAKRPKARNKILSDLSQTLVHFTVHIRKPYIFSGSLMTVLVFSLPFFFSDKDPCFGTEVELNFVKNITFMDVLANMVFVNLEKQFRMGDSQKDHFLFLLLLNSQKLANISPLKEIDRVGNEVVEENVRFKILSTRVQEFIELHGDRNFADVCKRIKKRIYRFEDKKRQLYSSHHENSLVNKNDLLLPRNAPLWFNDGNKEYTNLANSIIHILNANTVVNGSTAIRYSGRFLSKIFGMAVTEKNQKIFSILCWIPLNAIFLFYPNHLELWLAQYSRTIALIVKKICANKSVSITEAEINYELRGLINYIQLNCNSYNYSDWTKCFEYLTSIDSIKQVVDSVDIVETLQMIKSLF